MNSISKYLFCITTLSMLAACGTIGGSRLTEQSNPPNSSYVDQTAMSKEALRWVGRPYRFGGSNPASGFDCSGLVYYSALVTSGGVPPRTVVEQYAASRPIAPSEMKTGDLLFYQINKNWVDHVGIYVGNNSFVHAPQSGGVVKVVNMRTSYWTSRFAGARRLGK